MPKLQFIFYTETPEIELIEKDDKNKTIKFGVYWKNKEALEESLGFKLKTTPVKEKLSLESAEKLIWRKLLMETKENFTEDYRNKVIEIIKQIRGD